MSTQPTPPGSTEFERLAYEAALRALDHQERLVEELRGRTGLLLGAAALAVPFLAREAFMGDPPPGLAAIALAGFLVAVAASVYVLLPRGDLFAFALIGSGVYENLYSVRHDLAVVYRRLVYDLHDSWAENDRALRRLFLVLRIGTLALAVEITVLAGITADSLY